MLWDHICTAEQSFRSNKWENYLNALLLICVSSSTYFSTIVQSVTKTSQQAQEVNSFHLIHLDLSLLFHSPAPSSGEGTKLVGKRICSLGFKESFHVICMATTETKLSITRCTAVWSPCSSSFGWAESSSAPAKASLLSRGSGRALSAGAGTCLSEQHTAAAFTSLLARRCCWLPQGAGGQQSHSPAVPCFGGTREGFLMGALRTVASAIILIELLHKHKVRGSFPVL